MDEADRKQNMLTALQHACSHVLLVYGNPKFLIISHFWFCPSFINFTAVFDGCVRTML